jgi:hypothetical protein
LGNPKNWHFFDSLFSIKPLILAVDFTKGIQTELVGKASAAISMKQQTEEEKSKELINPLNPNELQDEVLSMFEQSGIGKELNGASTIFDGAAPYGLFPLYITDDTGKIETYTSEIVITSGDVEFQLQILTESNLTKGILQEKYINSIIQTRESPTLQIFEILKSEPFNLIDDYPSFIQKLENVVNGKKFIESYSKLLNSRIHNGKLKLGKKELFSFIKGCKIFIATIKKKGANAPILNNIDELTNNIISSATADILKNVFNQILANIIYILYYSQETEDDENILLDLFEYGVDFEYVEGEAIYGTKKEATDKSIDTSGLASEPDILELFHNVKRSQLLKPRHYLQGKVPLLSAGFSPLPSTRPIQKALTADTKSYHEIQSNARESNARESNARESNTRAWTSGVGVGTVESLQNNPNASLTSDLNTPLTNRVISEIRTRPANLASVEMIRPVSSNATTTTEAVKGFDSFFHNTPGNTQDVIETQMDEDDEKEPQTNKPQSQQKGLFSGGKKSKRRTKNKKNKNQNKKTKRVF